MVRAFVGGLPGVGKSSVLKMISSKTSIPTINLGDLMLNEAIKHDIVEYRDQLRSLEPAIQNQLRNQSLLNLTMESFLFDCHLTIRTESGLKESVPSDGFRKGLFTHIAVLNAPPETVYERRAARIGRQDPNDTVEDLQQQHIENLRVAKKLSESTGSALRTIDASSSVDETASSLMRFLNIL